GARAEDGFSGGSGGGGGSGMMKGGGPVSLSASEFTEYRENSLLQGLPLGERGRDRLRLLSSPVQSADTWSVALRQSAGTAVSLGRARLLVAEHAEGTEVIAGPS